MPQLLNSTVEVSDPAPATQIFVVKLASRCNLACTYCYMYKHVDQSWRAQPRFMHKKTVTALGARLRAHQERLGGRKLMVVAHGGEPLMYPNLDWFFGEMRTATNGRADFAIQTNGVLLNDRTVAILEKHQVHIGISIDGTRESHDAARVTHAGNGSFDAVVRGLAFARRRVPHLVDSLLQVINPVTDPKEVLDTLESFGVDRADFLLPDFNHDTIRWSGLQAGTIGSWLINAFDEWISRPEPPNIRFFTKTIELLLGSVNGSDQLGAFSNGAIMVETDGSYHIYDALRTSYEGAGRTGLSVYDASVDSIERLPLSSAFRDKASGAANACKRCSLFPVCGGGNPIHRYSEANAFNRPSVYCLDLKMIISHINDYLSTVRSDLCTVLH